MKWISVKDRLPDEPGQYLVCCTGGGKQYLNILCFDFDLSAIDDYDFPEYEYKGKAGFYDYDGECGYSVWDGITHWMPLPELPKEKA